MNTCPVCSNVHTPGICPACGFDDSCNYEMHPTLQKLQFSPKTIASHKAEFLHSSEDFVIQDKVLVEYTGEDADPIIPEGILEIGQEAFRGNEYIESVVIPEGVHKIGDCAFAECPELTWVQLPKSLRTIGTSAFSECPLESIELPEGLVSLGAEGTFYGTNIRKLVVPGSIKTIPAQCFSGCSDLEEVILKPGVRVIECEAFAHCGKLKTVTIPDTLEAVNAASAFMDGAFHGCDSLNTVIATESWRRAHVDVLDAMFDAIMTADAQYQKGETCYRARRYQEAISWYQKAANRGHALAQRQLGLLYKEGKDVEKDLDKAFQYFTQAANQGESFSQLQLGHCYWRGEAVKKDPNKAFTWFKLSAEQGNEEAQERTGYCYEKGDGTDRDINLAAYWYEKAAHNGRVPAMGLLGDCYADDDSAIKDYKKAVYWYQHAVDHGDTSALISLGNCYSDGKGVSQDPEKAIALFETAYAKGEILALGPILREYAMKDQLSEAECKHIISLTTPKPAADAESKRAQLRLISMLMARYGWNIGIDMVKYPATKTTGIEWIRKAAEGDEGSLNAQLWLGESYRLGDDLPKDKEKAIYWYEKAAKQGNQSAKEQLASMKMGLLGRLFF